MYLHIHIIKRVINKNIQEEREIRIESQLNWNLYKENLIKKMNSYKLIGKFNNQFTRDKMVEEKNAEWSGLIFKRI